MAINTINATIQMRKGLERDFDADQMTAGEWAVSTDTKYVRMCFAPGIVLRMATYEGFELDMEEIQEILKECQDIQVAVDAMAKAAQKSKTDADKSAKLSESWAKGGTGVRVGENTNNSKYYSDQAKALTDEASDLLDQAQNVVVAATQGALIPGGTVTFEDLPSNPAVGYMYNISNDFTTDSRFMEGAGIFYSAGANVYWTADGKWDVMVGTQVTGIKGANQISYQKGNVSLSADDIGAVGIGGDISSNTVTFEQAVERAGIESGDSMSVAFGKLSKYCADLESGVLSGLTGNVQNQLDLECLRVSKVLSSPGWYRILKLEPGNHRGNISAHGVSIGLTLCRNYNYSQPETVVMTIEVGYTSSPMVNIDNRNAYDLGHALFKAIRFTYEPTSKEHYLEVFYDSDNENTCSASISIRNAYLNNYRDKVYDFEPSNMEDYIWLYYLPITKENKTNGLRKVFTGNINIDDFLNDRCIGSYAHHSGTLSGIPSGLSSVGVWDTEYSIGDGDGKYLRQTYSPYDKSVFAQRIRNGDTISPWSVFYPGQYSLPLASATIRGGAKIGFPGDARNLAVKLSNEKMYVSLPRKMEVVNVPLTLNSNWQGSFYMKRFDELTFGIFLSLNAKVNIPDGDHVLFNIGGGIQLGNSNSPIFRMEYWHNSATDGRYFEVRQANYIKATNSINAYDYQVKKGDEYYYQGMFCLF